MESQSKINDGISLGFKMRNKSTLTRKETRILIVEDALVPRLEGQLSSIGFKVAGIATEEEDVKQLIPVLKPNLMFMDLDLVGNFMDPEVIANLESKYSIPIVFLASAENLELLEQTNLIRCYNFIHTPCQKSEIELAIEIALYKNHVENGVDLKKRELRQPKNPLEDELARRMKEFGNTNGDLQLGTEEKNTMEKHLVQFDELIEDSPDLIGVTKMDGEELYVNQEARNLLGLDSSEKIDLNIISWLIDQLEDIGQIDEIRKRLKAKGRWIGEIKLKIQKREVVILATILHNNGNNTKVANISFVGHDITAQKLDS